MPKPYSELGVSGFEVMRLLSLGTYDAVHALTSYTSKDSPALEGLDLGSVIQDLDTYKKAAEAYEPVLRRELSDKYNAELIMLYTFPSVALIVFYLILGMFMETLSMLLTTVPVVFPLVVQMGYDPVWFGILITVLMETALITPPIGVNLYVVQGIRTRGGAFNDVAWGALPFVLMMIVILMIFPGLALWLPNLVRPDRPAGHAASAPNPFPCVDGVISCLLHQ